MEDGWVDGWVDGTKMDGLEKTKELGELYS